MSEKIKLYTENDQQESDDSNNTPRLYNLFFIIQLTCITTIGGLLFGYDTGVIAGANLYLYTSFPNVTELDKETVVSTALIGAALASLVGGTLADKYGRKKIIIVADILFTIGAIIMGFAPSIPVLIIGRFIVGCGVGLAAMVVPVFLAESAPNEIRGRLITVNVLFITGGQFVATLICLALGHRWRWMLGLAGIPSFLQLIGIFFMPESASWLYSKGRIEEAEQSLRRVFTYEPEFEKRFLDLKHEAQSIKEESRLPYKDQFKSLFTHYRMCVFVGVMLQVWQQLCGINTAMYYGPEILKKSFDTDADEGSVSDKALLYSLPLSGMNALGTVVAVFFIDKLGRRWIMLRTLPFIGLSMFLVSIGFYVHNYVNADTDSHSGTWMIFSSIMAYLMFFSIGMGGTPWTVNSEIYPLHLRGLGNSMSTFANWISNFALAQIFLTTTNGKVGQIVTFAAIGLICFVAYIFIYSLVPETKGKTLEEVLHLFTKEEPKNQLRESFSASSDQQQQNQKQQNQQNQFQNNERESQSVQSEPQQ